MTEWPPKKITSAPREGWYRGHLKATEVGASQSGWRPYVLTNHAFAKRRPDLCLWLAPSCSDCLEYFEPDGLDLTICEDGGVFDRCDGPTCNRGPIPYREGWK